MKAKGRINLRSSFVVALLLAFVLQGQLAAGHIHLLSAGTSLALSDSGKSTVPKNQKQAPVEDNCPICQQLANTHAFLAQAVASLSLPELIGAQAFEIFDERAPVAIIALNWRSRAPPL